MITPLFTHETDVDLESFSHKLSQKQDEEDEEVIKTLRNSPLR